MLHLTIFVLLKCLPADEVGALVLLAKFSVVEIIDELGAKV